MGRIGQYGSHRRYEAPRSAIFKNLGTIWAKHGDLDIQTPALNASGAVHG